MLSLKETIEKNLIYDRSACGKVKERFDKVAKPLDSLGKFEELISPDFDCGGANDDYIHIVLTDEDDVPDAVGKLRSIYPRIMTIEYDNTRTRMMNTVEMSSDKPLRAKSSEELFEELYELQNGTCLTDTQKETVREIMSELQEGET